MKTIKPGLLFIVSILILIGCTQKQSLSWIPFQWESDTISGIYMEKAYIYIPVKIEDMPYDFTMQLDLGTYQTLFYGNSLAPYLEECPSLTDKYEAPFFKNVTLHAGAVELPSIDVGHMTNFGETIPKDSIHTKTAKHIGTITADIFHDRVLVIDYKSNRLAIVDSLPEAYKNLPAEKFELQNGLMILPFQINGKTAKVMFDTGSSPFELATTEKRALEIANPVIIDSLSGPLWWGNDITFYGMEVNKPIAFGGKPLTTTKVYYDKDSIWEKEVFTPLGIWGLTGNAFFLNHTVIIDYKNQLFRVE